MRDTFRKTANVDLDALALAARRKADPDAVQHYEIRNRLLLPIAAAAPGCEVRGAQIAPFWDRIAAKGPFSWVYEVEAALISELGRAQPKRDRQRAASPGIDTWITPRLVHRAIYNGWITWSPSETGLEAVESRIFPITPGWVASLISAYQPQTRSDILNMAVALTEAAGYPLPLGDVTRIITDYLSTGDVRLPTASLFCLLPARAPELSSHARLALIGGLGPLNDLNPARDGITPTLEKIESRVDGSGPRFSDLVLGMSLAIAAGQLPACETDIRAANHFWSSLEP